MGKQMRIEWACDTPTCDSIETNVQEDTYSHYPPKGWATLTLHQTNDGCECTCHDFDWSYEDEEEDEDGVKHPGHDEDDCPSCPPEGRGGQITICPICTQKVQKAYYKTSKGALL
jgi:hypothetical protein